MKIVSVEKQGKIINTSNRERRRDREREMVRERDRSIKKLVNSHCIRFRETGIYKDTYK